MRCVRQDYAVVNSLVDISVENSWISACNSRLSLCFDGLTVRICRVRACTHYLAAESPTVLARIFFHRHPANGAREHAPYAARTTFSGYAHWSAFRFTSRHRPTMLIHQRHTPPYPDDTTNKANLRVALQTHASPGPTNNTAYVRWNLPRCGCDARKTAAARSRALTA